MGTGAIVALVVTVTLVVMVGAMVLAVVRARRARAGPAVPDASAFQTLVAGMPARVWAPPFVPRRWVGMAAGGWSLGGGTVEVKLTGHVDRPPLSVLPRHRPEQDVGSSHLVDAMLAIPNRAGHEVPTGDAAFDARYRLTSGPDEDPSAVLAAASPPVRALLLDHDVVFLMLRHDGAWLSVFYGEPDQFTDTRQAAVRIVELLVSG